MNVSKNQVIENMLLGYCLWATVFIRTDTPCGYP